MSEDTVLCLSHSEVDDALVESASAVAADHGKHVESISVGADRDQVEWSDVDVTVALGGDGTFLEGVRLTAPSATPLLAVNAGTRELPRPTQPLKRFP
jgi:myo-inositol-1(or 4)-monophosphatase